MAIQKSLCFYMYTMERARAGLVLGLGFRWRRLSFDSYILHMVGSDRMNHAVWGSWYRYGSRCCHFRKTRNTKKEGPDSDSYEWIKVYVLGSFVLVDCFLFREVLLPAWVILFFILLWTPFRSFNKYHKIWEDFSFSTIVVSILSRIVSLVDCLEFPRYFCVSSDFLSFVESWESCQVFQQSASLIHSCRVLSVYLTFHCSVETFLIYNSCVSSKYLLLSGAFSVFSEPSLYDASTLR